MNIGNPKIEPIEFLKMRDIGEVLSLTFRFIRDYFKPLMLGILFLVLPFYILGTILMISALDGITPGVSEVETTSSIWSMMIAILFLAMGTVMIITYVNELIYFVYSNPDKQVPSIWEIWNLTRRYFFWNLLHMIVWFIVCWMFLMSVYLVFFLLITIGIAGVALGGVAIAVIMIILAVLAMFFVMLYTVSATVPMFFIATCEKINIFSALSRSFSLLHVSKIGFINSLLTNLLVVIIITIISSNILMPVLIIEGFIGYNSGSSNPFSEQGTLIKVFYGVTYLISPFVYMIPLISNAMNYFNLRERLDAPGLKKRISLIGQQTDFDIQQYEEE